MGLASKSRLRRMRVRQSNSAPVGVFTKVMDIFVMLDGGSYGLQLRAIAEQAKVNKSTAYRFLAHLEKAGYLVRDNTGAYLLEPRLGGLGYGRTFTSLHCRG